MSAYFCTSSVAWAGHDVYPTTDRLDDLDASRTGIHHHVMYTTPSLPTMLSHMMWFPCYRFWDFTKSFYISRCIFLHDKSLEYIPPTSSYAGEFSLMTLSCEQGFFPYPAVRAAPAFKKAMPKANLAVVGCECPSLLKTWPCRLGMSSTTTSDTFYKEIFW